MEQSQERSTLSRALVHFSRAMLLRCPVCGGGSIFINFFKLKDRCPTCGWVFARGEHGYQIGSMAFDLMIPLITWFFGFFGILILTWPNPPWRVLQWGSIAYMVLMPIVLYPFSHTLAIALDVLVRRPGDRNVSA
jgi:uncharacterized protein (DUF983 family)